MTRSLTSLLVIAPLLLAGCSGGGLSTSSLFGGEKKPAASNAALADGPTVVQNDPLQRPIQVGWTVAKAQRCGFYFDPAKIKSGMLAYEGSQGATIEELQKLEKAYDYARLSTQTKLKKAPNPCPEPDLNAIRADLPRYIAGDYTIVPRGKKKASSEGGLWSALSSDLQESDLVSTRDALKPRDAF